MSASKNRIFPTNMYNDNTIITEYCDEMHPVNNLIANCRQIGT